MTSRLTFTGCLALALHLALASHQAMAQQKSELPVTSKVFKKPSPPKQTEDKKEKPASDKKNALPVTSKSVPRAEADSGNVGSYGTPGPQYETRSEYPPEGYSFQYSYRYGIATRNGRPVHYGAAAQAQVTVDGKTQAVQSQTGPNSGMSAQFTTRQLMLGNKNFAFETETDWIRIFHTPRIIRVKVKPKKKRSKETVYTAKGLEEMKDRFPEAYKIYARFLPGLPAEKASGTAAPETQQLMNQTLNSLEKKLGKSVMGSNLMKDLRSKAEPESPKNRDN